MIVAIDGPAGAGKSTVARASANELGFLHMDTGAMYRAVAVAVLDEELDADDRDAVHDAVRSVEMALGEENVRLGTRDVTDRIRQSDVTEAVSTIAAKPLVRAALVPLQRSLAAGRDVVVEGRDIATVVFPDAEVKIYLTASPRERASRRAIQLGTSVTSDSIDDLERGIRARDERDATRSVSPLQREPSAMFIDSTAMRLDEVVARVVSIVNAYRARHG